MKNKVEFTFFVNDGNDIEFENPGTVPGTIHTMVENVYKEITDTLGREVSRKKIKKEDKKVLTVGNVEVGKG